MAKQNSLGIYKSILVTLITSLSITGISYLDNAIWNTIMIIVGLLSYSIVSILFSLHLIHGKNAGKEAYAFVFIILIILGYCVYNGIIAFQKWVLNWQLYIKILIPTILLLLITVSFILFLKAKRTNRDISQKKQVDEQKGD